MTESAWNRRGIALIVVLMILAVLLTLGTTLIVFQQLDKSVSHNYMDKVRARQAARAGVEFAIAKLNEEIRTGRCVADGKLRPSQYWGDVNDELGRTLPNEKLPLEDASNPSFAIETAGGDPYVTTNPSPRLVTMEGKRRGVSMAMSSGTYGVNGDVATLRVLDVQGRLYLNDGLHELGSEYRPVTENMRRMLNVLGTQKTVGIQDLGTMLIDRRPPEGYRTRRHLLAAVGGDPKLLERFEKFVTLHAWIDPNAVLPVPLSKETLGAYPLASHYYRGQGEPQFRGGRGVDYKGQKLNLPLRFAPYADAASHDVRVWGLDELKPTWIQVTKRAPVNVNAASREVLASLLAGLQGFYLLEQRRKFGDEAAYPYGGWGGLGLYHWMVTYYTYSPEKYAYRPWWTIWPNPNYTVDEADDLGRLYTTPAIASSAGGTSDPGGLSAESIADEIISCRNREKSRHFDYASAWFGGPFMSWRQFSAFCDNLVKVDFFKDQRTMFKDYPHQGADPWGWSETTIVSTIQQQFAAQAMADVLKANFNPNVHLNELNPDRALYLLVDKTDLLQNSTEFTFVPGGMFEIESLGRILRPTRGQDALTAMDNEVVASSVCRAQVQLFDMMRHSVQKDFYDGDFPRRTGASATNNNKGLESGPEPDNGTGPRECEFDGYVSLSTVGGMRKAHEKGTIEKTPFTNESENLGSKLHSHFNLDDRLHHHVDGPGYCDNLTRAELGNEAVENFSDPGGLSEPGPYVPDPLMGGGSRRLAWTFRVEPEQNLPVLEPRHPIDLRVDGIYSERHSGLAYWMSPNVQPKDSFFQNGSACYWLKPSFFPEMSGKSRQFLDVSVGAAKIVWGECPHEFTHYFYPGHDSLPGVVPILEKSNPTYIDKVAPTSMMFGMNWGGICTNTLNHESHGHKPKLRSLFRDHGWTHVILRWKKAVQAGVTDCAIYVNGRLEADPADFAMGHAAYSDVTTPNVNSFWYLRPDGSANSVRLGAPSKSQANYNIVWNTQMPYANNLSSGTAADNPNANHIQNWSADATIDEFYYWGVPTSNDFAPGLESALDLWTQGRYVAVEPHANEFLSKPLEFPFDKRVPPAPSRVVAPMPERKDTTTEEDEEARRAARPRSSTQAGSVFPPPHIDILAASWTMVTEEWDPATGEPFLYDHKDTTRVSPRLELCIKLGTMPISTIGTSEKFSVLSGGTGDSVRILPSQLPKYAVKFILESATPETILAESVFLDDVTILFTRGTEILSMEIE